ncbi:hypothetical protein [Anoxybacter fermentans]|uniref:hypothetical protein n=1 Tax=Anoxybacter fermentans TaxID=1323375 RepID=UPI000F8EBF8C|nr:hypothetical protein [Anoxybacter fermentans]
MKNKSKSIKGIKRARKIHDMETASILEHEDAFAMNEHLTDPKQSIPRPRSDLPKNKHHGSIHES